MMRRSAVAAFLAFFFAAFTLIAAAPHNHARLSSSVARGGDAVAVCLSGPVAAVSSCSLCEWLTLPSLPTLASISILLPALGAFVVFAPRALALCACPRPRPCPRGPPVLPIPITVTA